MSDLRGVELVFQDAGLDAATRSRASELTTCTPQGICVCEPSDLMVAGLAPTVRRDLYDRLAEWPENDFAAESFALPVAQRDRWARGEGLSPGLRDLMGRMIYERDGIVFFADMRTLCRAATNDAERIAILRVFWSLPSEMVWLRLDASSDIERLARWWGANGLQKSTQALLASLVDPDRETLVDIVHLLPPVPRRLLYTYPQPDAPPWDCGWTVANFFRASVEKASSAVDYAAEFLENTDAVPFEERRFGDTILFTAADGEIRHSATVLTDDLMFTKNGSGKFQPWHIETLAELKRGYASAPALQVRRRR